MRTIIAGGRGFRPREEDLALLDALRESIPITEVVCGCARGADSFGDSWAKARGIPVRYFPADWPTYGRSARVIRNEQMAQYAGALIAFPGGGGTADMIRRALRLGLKLEVVQ